MTETDDFDLTGFLPYLLNQAAEEASLTFQQVYKERYGMLRTEWRVLFHLGRYGPMTARQIGELAKIHKTKVSRAVQALEDKRFLTRQRRDDDRRRETLTLTQSGQAAYERLKTLAAEHNRSLRQMLPEKDWESLVRSLRVIARMD